MQNWTWTFYHSIPAGGSKTRSICYFSTTRTFVSFTNGTDLFVVVRFPPRLVDCVETTPMPTFPRPIGSCPFPPTRASPTPRANSTRPPRQPHCRPPATMPAKTCSSLAVAFVDAPIQTTTTTTTTIPQFDQNHQNLKPVLYTVRRNIPDPYGNQHDNDQTTAGPLPTE